MAHTLTNDDYDYIIGRIRQMVSDMKLADSRIHRDDLARNLIMTFTELICDSTWTSREDADTAYYKFDRCIKKLIEMDIEQSTESDNRATFQSWVSSIMQPCR